MVKNNRWRRMSELVDIDLEEMSASLKSFELELEESRSQLGYLSEYYCQSEKEFSQPSQYSSVHDIQRKIVFIESIQTAMSQQENYIVTQEQYLEKIKQQVFELYQKKESYLLLAKEVELKKIQHENYLEDEFLDELAQQYPNKPDHQ